MKTAATVSMTLLLSHALAAFQPGGAVFQQQPAPASIEGTVVRADTGQAVANAQVRLRDPRDSGIGFFIPVPAGAPALATARTVTTDSAGKFSFTNLEAVSYRLSATAPGYAIQEYRQTSDGSETPISLREGQALKEIVIRLNPTAAISGRILDETGQPATGASVKILRTHYTGRSKTYQAAFTASVDDRGQYRLFGITPGRYYLSVGDPPPISIEDRRAYREGVRGRYALQFYPGVSEVDQAVPVEVRTGPFEITIDMKVQRSRRYSVAGSVIDPTTGLPPPKAGIQLESLTPGSNAFYPVSYDQRTGTFEAPDVFPGSYIVHAQYQILDDAARAAGEAAWATFPSARVPITVIDKDLKDVTLVLKKPASASGRIRIEGQTVALEQARVDLEPTDNIRVVPPAGVVGADGTFQLIGLWEGEYSVHIQHYLQGLYVKSIKFDGTDILTQPFRFSGSDGGTMEILLHSGVAQLTGTATNARLQPVIGGYVVLLPERRNQTDLYRLVRSDQNGHFSFPNLAPGDYKIFVWETMEGTAYYDPEFVRQYEQQGKRITIAESSNVTVDVRSIPFP